MVRFLGDQTGNTITAIAIMNTLSLVHSLSLLTNRGVGCLFSHKDTIIILLSSTY